VAAEEATRRQAAAEEEQRRRQAAAADEQRRRQEAAAQTAAQVEALQRATLLEMQQRAQLIAEVAPLVRAYAGLGKEALLVHQSRIVTHADFAQVESSVREGLKRSLWLVPLVLNPLLLGQLPTLVLRIMRQQCTPEAASRAAAAGEALQGLDAVCAHVLSSRDPLTVLGVPLVGVSLEACRKRYHQLAKALHPDKTNHPRGAEAFRAVESAWRTIQAQMQ